MAQSPRIMSWRWGRVVVEAAPGPLRDAVLFPGGARAWDWRASGTGHRAGIQPNAVPEAIERYNALAATKPVGALIHSTC